MNRILINLSIMVSFFCWVGLASGQWLQTNGPTGYPAVSDLVSFAQIGTKLFACTFGEVLCSDDSGKSWLSRSNPNVGNLCMNSKGNILFVGGLGVKRSDDSGTTWSDASNGLSHFYVKTMVNVGDYIFCAGYSAGGGCIYRSSDSGKTWIWANEGLAAEPMEYLTVNNGVLYVCTPHCGGIFRSVDTGNTWNLFASSFSFYPGQPSNMAFVGSTLVVGTQFGGCFKSGDNGNTWQTMNSGFSQYRSLIVEALLYDGTWLFAGGTMEGGLYRNSDLANWVGIKSKTMHNDIVGLFNMGGRLVAATVNNMYYSDDHGSTWADADIRTVKTEIANLAVMGNTLFAASDAGTVFRSDNNGENWKTIFSGETYTSTEPSLVATGTILFNGTWRGILRSLDSGNTWNDTYESGVNILAMTVSGTNVYSADWSRIVYSSDSGSTWRNVSDEGLPYYNNYDSSEFTFVTCLAVSGSRVFVGTSDRGLFVSDGGRTWRSLGEQLPDLKYSTIYSILVQDSCVLVGIYGRGGVYRSMDYGNSWVLSDSGMRDSKIKYIHVKALAQHNGVIYAAANIYQKTFFRSFDGGISWSLFNGGMPVDLPYVTSLIVKDSVLFAGTDGNGVWRVPISGDLDAESCIDNLDNVSSLNLTCSPNPFNPAAHIGFVLPNRENVSLKVFDATGKQVSLLKQGIIDAGVYNLVWNAGQMAAGIYIVRIQAGKKMLSKKIVLTR